MSVQPSATKYIHGTSADEQRRLSTLNAFINQASLLELRLRGGERILDVGCGLAQFTRLMARAAGSLHRVVGIERDAAQLAEAQRQARGDHEEHLVNLRAGDATALPLAEAEWGAFDLVHTRFLLEHVADPLAVVRQMVRAVRPGGRIVLEDDDHDILRLWPEPPGFRSAWEAYIRTYLQPGNDPYVGRRLVSLLQQARATPLRNTWLFFGSCAGDPIFETVVANAIAILKGARETILIQGLIDAAAYDETVRNLAAWGERPDAALWYAICWAEGAKPS